MDRLREVAFAVGYLDADNPENIEWLRRAVWFASRPVLEAGLELKNAAGDWYRNDVAWGFCGWAHRTKGLAWASARFLSTALLDYWEWENPHRKKPPRKPQKALDPFRLDPTHLDHYLAQRCRGFLYMKGFRVLSILQAFHYFTEFLVAHGYHNAEDAHSLQTTCAKLYEAARCLADACDSGYWICPTYDTLIAVPNATPAEARRDQASA